MSERGGFCPTRLGRLREVMTGYVERGEAPGLVALVSRRGETHVVVAGKLALDGDAPMERDSLFRIASMSKPIAAVAAMVLLEECRLRLDDPVDEWLPELANPRVLTRIDGPLDDTVPADRSITLRDLLTLRMGLGYVFSEGDSPIKQALRERNVLQGPPHPLSWPEPDVWMGRVGELPLMRQPGEAWMYDLGIDVLGVLIARAAGMPLGDFLRERIFAPLGMVDTSFGVTADKIDRLTTSYSVNWETGALALYDAAAGGDWSDSPRFPAAASGLVSTADDYLAFAQMLMNGGRLGGQRILSRPSVEMMTTNQLTADQQKGAGLILGEQNGWGFGMSVVTRRDAASDSVGKYGWMGGLGSSWHNDPAEEMITILLTQRSFTSPTAPLVVQDFETTAYQAIDD